MKLDVALNVEDWTLGDDGLTLYKAPDNGGLIVCRFRRPTDALLMQAVLKSFLAQQAGLDED